MFTVQHIYAYQSDSKQITVFTDRLYPRSVRKEVFSTAFWLRGTTPGANLRRWYRGNPTQNFDGSVSRYHEELQGDIEQAAIKRLLDLKKQHGNILLLAIVKDPRHSRVSALAQFLGASFEYRD